VTLPESVNVLKGLAETIAIAVGGLWAAWTFHKLQRTRASEAELNKSLTETRESERRLVAQEPNLEVEVVEVVEHYVSGTEKGYLAVTVQLSNSGLRNLAVTFEESALRVGRVQPGDESSKRLLDVNRAGARYFPEHGNKLEQMPPRIFRVGQHRRMLLLARISEPGLYFVQYQVMYQAIEFDMETPPENDIETPPENAVYPVVIRAVEQRLVHVEGVGGSLQRSRNDDDPITSPP
jgi:hypothetical protein